MVHFKVRKKQTGRQTKAKTVSAKAPIQRRFYNMDNFDHVA